MKICPKCKRKYVPLKHDPVDTDICKLCRDGIVLNPKRKRVK